MTEESTEGNNYCASPGVQNEENGRTRSFGPTSSCVLPNDTTERAALANLLRCPELQNALLGVNCPSEIADAISIPAAQVVYDTAQHLYDRDQQLPTEPRVFLVETERYLRETDNWNDAAREPLDELVNWCFSPDVGTISPARGRELWCEQIRGQVLGPLLRNASTNVLSSPATMTTAMGSVSRLWEWLGAFERGEQANEPQGPYSTDQFRQQIGEREELIGGVLVANQVGLVAAATKAMKTVTMLDMSISLSTGTAWMGYEAWRCHQPKKVWFCSAESGQETLIHKHDIIAGVKRSRIPIEQHEQFDQLLSENLYWDYKLPDLGDESSLKHFAEKVANRNIDVVFLDPLSLAMGSASKDLPNLSVGGQVILRAAAVFRDVGATLVFIHHTAGDRQRQQMGRSREPLELQDAAYPSIVNHVRQWILLSRAEPYQVSERRSALWVRIGGSGLQSGGDFRATITEGPDHSLWDVRVESGAQFIEGEVARRQIEANTDRQNNQRRVLAYLRANPGASRNEMARNTQELSGIGDATLRQMLQDLLGHGAIRKDHQDRGQGSRYYAIYANGERIESETTDGTSES